MTEPSSPSTEEQVETPVVGRDWRRRLREWIFPPGVPYEAQLWRWENIAIPCCYLLVGTFQGLASSVLNVYPLQLGASEAQQTTIKVLRSLPASFKIVFGFISDGFPVLGYRRKLYMAAGWALAALTSMYLALISNPSIKAFSALIFLNSFGFWFADVIGDSLVAEKAKLEPEEHRGTLQSTCYACRFFMNTVSVFFSLAFYEWFPPRVIFWILAILPLVIMGPTIWTLREEKNVPVAAVQVQLNEIWNAVCSRAVWQPMAFVYLYNLFQISNAAWTQFQFDGLGFSTLMLNSFLVEAYALVFVGIIVYNRWMRNMSWRRIYFITTIINSLVSALQFVLIFGLNRKFGIPDYFFALGDDVVVEFIQGIQFLPTTIMVI
jgi:hypothetical protein